MVQPFPRPGPLLRLAFRELDIAAHGDDEQRKALGPIADLPRPWAPASCTDPKLRAELWTWLDAVAVWHNHELVFDTGDAIPPCWPQHPHLVHELALLADLRRRAERAVTSDALEEWHRYALPAFLERMRHRIAEHCNEIHPAMWPSAGRFNRHLSDESARARQTAFTDDVATTQELHHANHGRATAAPYLHLIDTETGELLD